MRGGLSSTNIVELLESELNAVKDIQKVILNAKLNAHSLKSVSNTLNGLTDVIKSLVGLSKELSNLKLGFFGGIKARFALKHFLGSIEQIVNFCVFIRIKSMSINNIAIKKLVFMAYLLTAISKRILEFTLVSGFGLTFIAATVALLALRGFVFIFTLLFDYNTLKKLRRADKTIHVLSMSVALLSMSVVLFVLTGVLIAESAPAFQMVLSYLGVVAIIFIGVGYLVKGMKELNLNKGILYISAAIAALAMTVVLLVHAGKLINEEWEAIGKVAAYIGILTVVFMGVALASRWIKEGTKSLMYAAVAVAILAFTTLIIVAVSYIVNDDWAGIIQVFAMMTILTAAIIGIGYAAKLVDKGNKTVFVLTIAVLAMVGCMFLISDASEKLTWSGIGMFLAIVGSMSALAIGLGIPAVAPFVEAGAFGMLLIAGAMLGMSTAMMLMVKTFEMIQNLGITEDNIDTITMPIRMMTGVVSSICDLVSTKQLLEASAKMASLTFITVGLGIMAKVISDIANLKIPTEFDEKGNGKQWQTITADDFKKAALGAVAICSIISGLFADEAQEILLPDGSKVKFDPLSQSALDNIGIKASWKIRKLASITEHIGIMAQVVQNVASLKVPTAFDKDGKPTHFESMKTSDFINASKNVAIIATTILSALSNKDLLSSIEDMSKLSIKKMQLIFDACGHIGGLVDAIKGVAVLSVADEFDKSGNPIHYKILNETELQEAENRVVDIMTFFIKAMASDEINSILDNLDKKAIKNMELINNSCSGLTGMIDSIKTAASFDELMIGDGIAKIQTIIVGYANMMDSLFNENSHIETSWKKGPLGIKYPTFKKVIDSAALIDMKTINAALYNIKQVEKTTEPFKRIVDTFNGITPAREDPKKKSPLQTLTDYITTVSAIEKMDTSKVKTNVDNLTKFIDKSNSVNVDKIKSVTEMFGQMADFSKSINGNFEKLADVLNDKVVETLDKISGSLKTISESKLSTSTQSASTEAAKPGISDVEKANNDNKQQTVDLSELQESVDDIKKMVKILAQVIQNNIVN